MLAKWTVASFFSGVGGLDVGFTGDRWEHLFLCEIDANCRAVLRRHFPGVPIFDDVQTFDPAPWRGRVDLVVGGVPCQDWSVAGRRAGLAGGRSGLFFDFARQVDALDPRWVIFENVAGLLSACSCPRCPRRVRPGHSGRDFAIVLAELTGWHPEPPKGGWRGAGYCCGDKGGAAWRVLDGRGFGVPHRRRRVFVVVERAGAGAGAVQVLLDPEGREGRPPTSGEAQADAAEAPARRSVPISGGGLVDDAAPLLARDSKGATSDIDQALVVSCLDARGGGVDDNEAQGNQLVVVPPRRGPADRGNRRVQDDRHRRRDMGGDR